MTHVTKGGFTQENKGKFWLLYPVIPAEHFNLTDKKTQRIAYHWTNLKPMRTKGHKDVVKNQTYLEHELASKRHDGYTEEGLRKELKKLKEKRKNLFTEQSSTE